MYQESSEIYLSSISTILRLCVFGGKQCEKGGRKKGNVICSMQGERNPVRLSLLPGYFLIRKLSVLQGSPCFAATHCSNIRYVLSGSISNLAIIIEC